MNKKFSEPINQKTWLDAETNNSRLLPSEHETMMVVANINKPALIQWFVFAGQY